MTSDFGVESHELPVCKTPKISRPSDQGRLTAVDLVQGAILELGNHRGRGIDVFCLIESQKMETSG
jgi:hypothetical protein